MPYLTLSDFVTKSTTLSRATRLPIPFSMQLKCCLTPIDLPRKVKKSRLKERTMDCTARIRLVRPPRLPSLFGANRHAAPPPCATGFYAGTHCPQSIAMHRDVCQCTIPIFLLACPRSCRRLVAAPSGTSEILLNDGKKSLIVRSSLLLLLAKSFSF